MSDEILSSIKDAHLLTDIFGRWPSFHDAEIIRLSIDAALTLEIDIEHWRMLPEIDDRGYYKHDFRCLTTLQFTGVLLDKIEHFADQNVLSSLRISEATSNLMREKVKPWYWVEQLENAKYHVELDAIIGCSRDYLCQAIQVAKVQRLD